MEDAQRLADIRQRYEYWEAQFKALDTIQQQMQLDIGFLLEKVEVTEIEPSKQIPYQSGGDR